MFLSTNFSSVHKIFSVCINIWIFCESIINLFVECDIDCSTYIKSYNWFAKKRKRQLCGGSPILYALWHVMWSDLIICSYMQYIGSSNFVYAFQLCVRFSTFNFNFVFRLVMVVTYQCWFIFLSYCLSIIFVFLVVVLFISLLVGSLYIQLYLACWLLVFFSCAPNCQTHTIYLWASFVRIFIWVS